MKMKSRFGIRPVKKMKMKKDSNPIKNYKKSNPAIAGFFYCQISEVKK